MDQRCNKARAAPYFLWLHLIEPQNWQKDYPRSRHGSRPHNRYDLSHSATDKALSPLLARFKSKRERDKSIVVVTSDHGEALGDKGFR